MPKVNGLEVLRFLKNDNLLRLIPVVAFTSSDAPTDIRQAYFNYVNAYVMKPHSFIDYNNAINEVYSFWIDYAKRYND
jgi:CheY-like chemotaxis protein